jgi:cardiolipin synthase
LQNGDEIFPAMLEAIRGASTSVTFETYIYWSGEIGEAFTEALSEKARAGIPVRVTVDWVGSLKMDSALLDQMVKAGVQLQRYRPLHWYNLGRMNNRTHRKLLVVDGKIGFTGGVGIADQWQGDAGDPEHWRDSHFRFEGPAVAQLQAAFNDNWI